MTATMKAAIRTGLMGTTLTFTNDYPQPKIDPKQKQQVLVKIHSAAINPVDYKAGKFLMGNVVGMDFCGTVEELGSDSGSDSSGGLKKGDLVYGSCKGSNSEYAIASIGSVAKAPSSSAPWKPSELAALNVAYVSALQCLKRGNIISSSDDGNGSLVAGKTSILVIGASGGCGIACLQLCKAVGVKRIIAICSSKNEALVKEMGATEVIDYTKQDELTKFYNDNVGLIDCVYDVASNSGGGEDYWDRSVPLLKESGGELVALNGPPLKWMKYFTGNQKKNESMILAKSNTADLELAVRLLDKTGARPLVHTMPFTEDGFHEAFDLLKSRRTRGKIVLDIIAS